MLLTGDNIEYSSSSINGYQSRTRIINCVFEVYRFTWHRKQIYMNWIFENWLLIIIIIIIHKCYDDWIQKQIDDDYYYFVMVKFFFSFINDEHFCFLFTSFNLYRMNEEWRKLTDGKKKKFFFWSSNTFLPKAQWWWWWWCSCIWRHRHNLLLYGMLLLLFNIQVKKEKK